ncbi:MAG: hypothetical protein TYPL_2190 [Candidatus Tyloplasma litorale]|nr:MAG: hypothetical protein TYPL_2190 [Mycoplasmatales bacterium]
MYKKSKNKLTIIINTSQSSLINVTPKKFSDSRLIGKELLKGNAIVVDINEMPSVESIRFIDFVTGLLFVTNGSFKKVAKKIYLLAPTSEILDKFSNQFQ